ncbi:MAG: hypothetical protein HF981_00550 [Desulfobacteraceae bacterium]|nr:hypothetical protein [Desulfobacteraceae bacterium]MBC2748858.1 hypothetical protein [Desulfobacteraceae bacterium]
MENNNSQKKSGQTLSIIALLLIGGLLAFEIWQVKNQGEKIAELLSEIEVVKTELAEFKSEVSILSNVSGELKEKTEKIFNDLLEIKLEKLMEDPSRVNFTESTIQNIGNGFFVTDLEMKEHLTGIKLSGRVINTQSVRHENITFKAFMSGQVKAFTINRISPGNSTKFSVYIPDVDVKMTTYGSIQYQRSSVEYFIK